MVIECIIGRHKARFGCLKRNIDINFDNLPHVIHHCFILHNFCKINKEQTEQINRQQVTDALKYYVLFQPLLQWSYKVDNKQKGKNIRNIFAKNFS